MSSTRLYAEIRSGIKYVYNDSFMFHMYATCGCMCKAPSACMQSMLILGGLEARPQGIFEN